MNLNCKSADLTKKVSIVNEQLFVLNEELMATYHKCKYLEEKLNMVLNPVLDSGDKDCADMNNSAPIVNELDKVINRVKSINRFLVDVTDRVVC